MQTVDLVGQHLGQHCLNAMGHNDSLLQQVRSRSGSPESVVPISTTITPAWLHGPDREFGQITLETLIELDEPSRERVGHWTDMEYQALSEGRYVRQYHVQAYVNHKTCEARTLHFAEDD